MNVKILSSFFAFRSIRQQLIILISLVVFFSLLLASLFFYYTSYNSFRERYAHDMLAYTEMIGYNTQSSVLFNAPDELNELLPRLVTNSDIEIICLVTPERKVFHTWVRDNKRPKWIVIPAHPEKGFYQFNEGYIEVVVDSDLEGEKVSTLYLRASTQSFRFHMFRLIKSMIAIFALAAFFALLGAYVIAKIISTPVLSLARLTNRISIDKDYSLRIPESTKSGEIKILNEGFNNMLGVIENQNNEILIAFKEIYDQKNQIEKQKLKIEEQQEILKEWNRDINSSIKYAKNIQSNMLPPIEVLRSIYPDLFVMFEPRDIVSGDFYWFEKVGDWFFVAAVDCTGHGVPGAMISVIGYNFLNQIVRDRGILETNNILDALDLEIRSFFRKDSAGVKSDDGMDIGIARLNIATKELEFSGAYNPALIIRNGDIIELEADRQALGSVKAGKKIPFSVKRCFLQQDDTVYLFSDGYADQFGGDKGRKYLKQHFRTLLAEVSQFPIMEQQKRLEDNFFKWMGNYHQVDDVMVIGIKV